MLKEEEKAQIKEAHLTAMERRLYSLELDYIGTEAAGDKKSCRQLEVQIEAMKKAIQAVRERG